MDFFFYETVNTDPSDSGNWFDGGMTPTGTIPGPMDDVYLTSGICSTSAGISYANLYVSYGCTLSVHSSGTIATNGGTITLIETGGTLAYNSGTVSDNRGTVTDNSGTITVNYGTVSANSGSIGTDWTASTTRYFIDQGDHSPGTASNWFKDTTGVLAGYTPGGEDVVIYAGTCSTTTGISYATLVVGMGAVLTSNADTVATNNGTITTNSGTVTANASAITTNAVGAIVMVNNGTITTNSGTVTINGGTITTNSSSGSVTTHLGTITTNSGQITLNGGGVTTNASGGVVSTNSGTITTNSPGGIVTSNTYGSGVITNNNGVLRIGTVTGGTGSLVATFTTNLASHTAGANVTLPSGGGSLAWW